MSTIEIIGAIAIIHYSSEIIASCLKFIWTAWNDRRREAWLIRYGIEARIRLGDAMAAAGMPTCLVPISCGITTVMVAVGMDKDRRRTYPIFMLNDEAMQYSIAAAVEAERNGMRGD